MTETQLKSGPNEIKSQFLWSEVIHSSVTWTLTVLSPGVSRLVLEHKDVVGIPVVAC